MPRGRMLNKKISFDEQVANLSLRSALFYTWCIPNLDVEGRIYADSVYLRGVVVPYRKEFTTKIISLCIDEMIKNNLVIVYGDYRKYMQFIGFTKNQNVNKDREAPSEIPKPTQEELRSNSGVSPAKDNISKVKLSKDKYKEFVFLSKEEYKKLLEKFGEDTTYRWILKLNDYVGSKGKKYSSHYHTILNWARMEEEKGGGAEAERKNEHLLAQAKEALSKMAKPEMVAKWLEQLSQSYHSKLKKFLTTQYKDGEKVYYNGEDIFFKQKH